MRPRTNRITALLAAGATLLMLLTGCSPIKPDLTVETAKAQTLAQEREFADIVTGLLPEGAIVNIEQMESGVLLSCDRNNRGYVWTGRITLHLSPGTPTATLLADIARAADAQERFTAVHQFVDGREEAIVSGPHSESYFISIRGKGTRLDIASFSECFHLPEGVWSGGDF